MYACGHFFSIVTNRQNNQPNIHFTYLLICLHLRTHSVSAIFTAVRLNRLCLFVSLFAAASVLFLCCGVWHKCIVYVCFIYRYLFSFVLLCFVGSALNRRCLFLIMIYFSLAVVSWIWSCSYERSSMSFVYFFHHLRSIWNRNVFGLRRSILFDFLLRKSVSSSTVNETFLPSPLPSKNGPIAFNYDNIMCISISSNAIITFQMSPNGSNSKRKSGKIGRLESKQRQFIIHWFFRFVVCTENIFILIWVITWFDCYAEYTLNVDVDVEIHVLKGFLNLYMRCSTMTTRCQ